MRILHIFPFLSPNANGTITTTRQLSMALARNGHQVGIFTSDFEMTTEYLESLSPVKIYSYSTWLKLPGYYFYLSPATITRARNVTREFEVLHLHCLRSFQNIVVYYYARKYAIPYILDQHGSLPRSVAGEKGPRCLLRWLFDLIFGNRIIRDAAKVVAQNRFAVREYRKFGVKDDRMALIPLLFPVEDFADLPTPGGFRKRYDLGGKPVIMSMCRLNHIKGLDFLVESFYELSRSGSEAVLAIVGPDEGYRAELERMVSELNLSDRVLFTGFLDGRDKLEALVDADVVVQPSRYEQAAWGPIEAVLCGTPVIVSGGTGSAEDVSTMDAGYLVEYGDKIGMMQTIQMILEDPAAAVEKVNRAREYIVENLAFSSRIADYENLYREVTELNSPVRRNK